MKASIWQSPLGQFQTDVAAAHPTPAAVATASVTAALGLSLLMKALRIKGDHEDLLPLAERLIENLRAVADDDVAAVANYVQTRNAVDLREVPDRAYRLVQEAQNLCKQAAPHITGLISADVKAASAIVQGAVDGIEACIIANLPPANMPSQV